MVSDRDRLLLSNEEFEALRVTEKSKEKERKKQLRLAIKTKKQTISKIKRIKGKLGKKLGMSFEKITKGIKGRRRMTKKKAMASRKLRVVKVLREKIEKKRSKIVGIFEKRQEEKSLFIK